MGLKNTTASFGTLTKLTHWAIFILFVLQYFLVYRREYFPKDSPEKLQYILLHKSVGTLLLLLALFMILWRQMGQRPPFPSNMSKTEIFFAKLIHFLLYFSMLLMPIIGILMSQFGGRAVSFFGQFELPTLVAKNKALAGVMYDSHVILSYIIIAIVTLHALAALAHHFIKKDNVLKRMLMN